MDGTSPQNRFAPPQAAVADVGAASGSGLLAGRWRRFWGAVLDSLLLGLLIWILSLITPWNAFNMNDRGNPFTHIAVLNQAFSFALFVAINGYLLATRGQTIAKAMLGMRIVRPDGSAVGFGRLMLRYGVGSFVGIVSGLAFIYGLIDAVMIFRSNRRCLHDEIAGTMVVRV